MPIVIEHTDATIATAVCGQDQITFETTRTKRRPRQEPSPGSVHVLCDDGLVGRKWLFEGVNRLLKEFDDKTGYILPPVDVVESADAYHFYFEIAGLRKGSLDANVKNGRLIIVAERTRLECPHQTKIHVTERNYGLIRRTLNLPRDADLSRIQTSYNDGVFEVKIEKKSVLKSARS